MQKYTTQNIFYAKLNWFQSEQQYSTSNLLNTKSN